MARTEQQENEIAAVKAELAELLEFSRELLAEERDDSGDGLAAEPDFVGTQRGGVEFPDRADADDLAGIELSFGDELEDENEEDLLDGEIEPSEEVTDVWDELGSRVAQNPLYWVAGAAIVGFVGFRLLSSSKPEKNPGEKASLLGDFPITHGSVSETLIKTGFDLAKPALMRASKEWLSRIVETRS